jgi:L-seryl-tRNA(Ser) seleniumtransferase
LKENERIPSVDFILNHELIKDCRIKEPTLLKRAVKDFLSIYKAEKGINITNKDSFVQNVRNYIDNLCKSQLKEVVNATGIILHTNLGRAPLSEHILNNSFASLSSYSNLEFDLQSGKRGNRNTHLKDLIKLVTGAEDCLIVNNNSAAVFLMLNQFAKNKEVIVSRSELIEIGGSFRIPDIMAASGCVLHEVGTTNCTNIEDYKAAINENTGLVFKAHQSNFYIAGHTEDVPIEALSDLAKKNHLPFIYDLGSGLLKDIEGLLIKEEPNVQDCLAKGIDLISFSGDKLLGGPQCGIIVGKKELISQLAKNPLMRIIRVDKLTLRILFESLSLYFDEKKLLEHNPLFKMLSQSKSDIKAKALFFTETLKKNNIACEIVSSEGRTGGGTMPYLELPSFSVQLHLNNMLAEKVYIELMKADTPVVAVLKEGKLSFNMLTLFEKETRIILNVLSDIMQRIE